MKKIVCVPKVSLSLIVCSAALAFSSASHATKLYKWVDEKGNISYQDQPPPENAKVLKEDTIEASTAANADASANTTPVVVYVVNDCPSCDSLIARLKSMGLTTESRLLNEDDEATRRILEQADSLSVPTVFLGDKIITDTSPGTLSRQLEETGYKLSNNSTSADETATPAAEQ